VVIVYLLTTALVVALLAYLIPLIVTELNVLGRRLPGFAQDVYRAAPEVVQEWLDRYNRSVPEEIRQALERSIEDTLQSLITALQAGAFRTVSVLFSTVSFLIGLFIVPLWMFYFMRDQPEIETSLFRMVPKPYRDDVRCIQALVESVLSSYLRGQVILSLSVGIMTTLGLELLGIDFALLLGTIGGLLEIVPVMGPILAAIPVIVVTLATSPSKLLLVVLLAFAVQQIENYVLVPQITHGVVRLHPAMSMLILVIGSAVGGAVGVVLSIPLAAMIRDISRYAYLRLADDSQSPQAALAKVHSASG
jgi:predicted PurR-regulated permease PerM